MFAVAAAVQYFLQTALLDVEQGNSCRSVFLYPGMHPGKWMAFSSA